jgi:hypothetical protein
MKKERILIAILLVLILWLTSAVIRLENYHYAVQVGLCDEIHGLDQLIEKDKCLNAAQTRTHSFWHLLYGLRIL